MLPTVCCTVNSETTTTSKIFVFCLNSSSWLARANEMTGWCSAVERDSGSRLMTFHMSVLSQPLKFNETESKAMTAHLVSVKFRLNSWIGWIPPANFISFETRIIRQFQCKLNDSCLWNCKLATQSRLPSHQGDQTKPTLLGLLLSSDLLEEHFYQNGVR